MLVNIFIRVLTGVLEVDADPPEAAVELDRGRQDNRHRLVLKDLIVDSLQRVRRKVIRVDLERVLDISSSRKSPRYQLA